MANTTWPTEIATHPAAELFPLMTGADFVELVEDIKTNGLLDPIVQTKDGRILDGRNRYRACIEADIQPTFRTYNGEPWQFVISANLHRRHLTDGQRAMIAAKIAERYTGQRPRSDMSPDTFDLPPSRREAADLLKVSETSIARAHIVGKHGTDDLKAIVETGAVPITTAARVARMSPAEQDRFVEAVRAGDVPRKAAPPEVRSPSHVKETNYYNADRSVLGRKAIANLVHGVGGYAMAIVKTVALDESITSEEAARWANDLAQSISNLRKFRNLLRERVS